MAVGTTATAVTTATTAVATANHRFRPVPPFTDADERVCYSFRGEDAPLNLKPSTQRFEVYPGTDDVETMTFTLHNESGATLSFNLYDWEIRQQTESGWKRVAPDAVPEPITTLKSGATHEWRLGAEEGFSSVGSNAACADLTSANTYAFQVVGFYGAVITDSGDIHGTAENPATSTVDEKTEAGCIAVFEYREAVP